jgi:antitoxin CptB
MKENNLAYSQTELSYIRWKCRRGMLELDELLQHFFDHGFLQMSVELQQSFVELLSSTDPELFSWLMNATPAPQAQWQLLVQKIRAAKQS